MANTKLDRIERDIEKTRAKILEQQMCIRDREVRAIVKGKGKDPKQKA